MDRPTVLLLASMLVRLRGLLGEFELRPRSLAESSGASLALDLDPSQVTRLLRSALSELPDYRLRALLHETDPESRLDDEGVVERLAQRIARGDLILVREVHAGISPSDPDAPDVPDDDDDVIERLDWIEILIEDEDHQPVPNVAYQLTLPDGSTRRGQTNKLGIVRYDHIPSGTCKFSLVELDTKAWEKA